MFILGISAFYHDSAACLIQDGQVIAAAQEERFTRVKNDKVFPQLAIKFCLVQANISAEMIDFVVFYEKPFLKFDRLLETYLSCAPRGFKSFARAMPTWIKEKLFQKSVLIKNLQTGIDSKVCWHTRLHFSEHHLSHAGSAFFPSPFEQAAIITLDGVGEWTTSSVAIGKGSGIEIIKEMRFPHSLGLLYSAFTYYLGFKVNSGEYKVMGLAPYGKPRFSSLIYEKLLNIAEDGSFNLDMSYFDFAGGLKMTNQKFDSLFGGMPRKPESKLTPRHMDLAASIQEVIEKIVLKIVGNVRQETGERNLCLAGGVALNSVVNGLIVESGIFDNVWIQPASGDAGGALGAALCMAHITNGVKREPSIQQDGMLGAYLGPEFENESIEKELNRLGARYLKLNELELLDHVTDALVGGQAVGWFQGRMEFGPRALGSRSIIADPRRMDMQKQLNLKVKFRESFRPFAPSVLREQVSDWFDLEMDSPYMALVVKVKKERWKLIEKKSRRITGLKLLDHRRSEIPAVTHVDYSARVQTVSEQTNPKFHNLIANFFRATGCPVVVNTSFNVRGEPIVCSPTDAYRCFMSTDLDVLAIGDYFLKKTDQIDLQNIDSTVVFNHD